MILDSLARAARYEGLGPGIAAGLRWLRSFDPALPNARVEIEGDAVFALIQHYHTTPGAEKRFESHHAHLDIQFVAAGRERILHADADALQIDTPYDVDTDVAFHHEPGVSSSLLLRTGDFAIFWPADAHKPGCMAGGRDPVRKVVVKVRL